MEEYFLKALIALPCLLSQALAGALLPREPHQSMWSAAVPQHSSLPSGIISQYYRVAATRTGTLCCLFVHSCSLCCQLSITVRIPEKNHLKEKRLVLAHRSEVSVHGHSAVVSVLRQNNRIGREHVVEQSSPVVVAGEQKKETLG